VTKVEKDADDIRTIITVDTLRYKQARSADEDALNDTRTALDANTDYG
jgi:hypothetical protein